MHPEWRQALTRLGYTVTDVDGISRASRPLDDNASVVDLSNVGVLELRGQDARTFLQGYVTCDVNDLDAAGTLEGGYCNLQGRLVTDFTLTEHDGALLLIVDRTVIPRVVKSLAKYLMFSKSKLADRSDAFVAFGVIDAAVDRGIRIDVPGARARTLVLASLADANAVFERFHDRLGDDRLWRRLDIEAMRAHVTDATSEAFLPQMWGLADRNAISFTKGCYLGQEVVARAQHRGQVKRSLGRLTWRGAMPHAGLTIRERDGNASATVVSFVETSANEGVALAIGAASAWTTTLHADGITFAQS